MSNSKKRYLYFWIYMVIGYIFPLVYYWIKISSSKQIEIKGKAVPISILMPIAFIGFVLVIKLCQVVPEWVKTWKPSFKKGIIKAIPIYLLTTVLITLGTTLKTLFKESIELAFTSYFEFVFVFFGALCIASVFNAMHLKYKELDLIEKGYVLGVVNK